jgi:hypothetical protein
VAKRLMFIISTEKKSIEQIKTEARQALRKFHESEKEQRQQRQ